MNRKQEIVNQILNKRKNNLAAITNAKQFAPTNIALCKYWGKRDQDLNLPVTSSLSISLKDKGTVAQVSINQQAYDEIWLNDQLLNRDSAHYKRITCFLDLFRANPDSFFRIELCSNIPIAAGVASSASIFAALILVLDQFYAWQLSKQELSILARLGSGSACRSIWQGFVEWQCGSRSNGMDSYGKPIARQWPELRVGLLILSQQKKIMSSREAMQHTINTSPFYNSWPKVVTSDMLAIKNAIASEDFPLFGQTVEGNALAMHATLLAARPAVFYYLPETVNAMQKIWRLRSENVKVFFTQDAGANLILFFLSEEKNILLEHFPNLEIIQPFC